MKMPEPKPDDARWNLQLAGGCVMDLGCYGLHVNRQLARFAGGDPTIVSARGTERSPGVDASFDIDLAFPTGASGWIISSMTADGYEMTLRLIGREGRSVRPRLPAPVRRRPHRDHDRRRHHGRAPRNPLHVHLPTAGLRRPPPARHAAATRRRRRRHEHAIHRHRLHRGRHVPTLTAAQRTTSSCKPHRVGDHFVLLNRVDCTCERHHSRAADAGDDRRRRAGGAVARIAW